VEEAMSRNSGKERGISAFVFATACATFFASAAIATSIDTSPRQALLLPRSGQLVAQISLSSVGLYELADRSLVRSFPVPTLVRWMAVTDDEKVLVMGCIDGSIMGRDLTTGQELWTLSLSGIAPSYARGITFSQDSQSFVASGVDGLVPVFETRTGRGRGGVSFPKGTAPIESAALCPDGSTGVFVSQTGSLVSFDVATGKWQRTDVMGAGPVRYSVDGKHIALGIYSPQDHPWIERAGRLRIVNADGSWTVLDLGSFAEVIRIKAVADGGFVVLAAINETDGRGFRIGSDWVGVRWRPGNKDIDELWRIPRKYGYEEPPMDFDPEKLTGVHTNHRFVTDIWDLRTGDLVNAIDNSANYRVRYTSSYNPGLFGLLRMWHVWGPDSGWGPLLCGTVVLGGVIAFWLVIRRRRAINRFRTNSILGPTADDSRRPGFPPSSDQIRPS
jgi:WD40 repeat protein